MIKSVEIHVCVYSGGQGAKQDFSRWIFEFSSVSFMNL